LDIQLLNSHSIQDDDLEHNYHIPTSFNLSIRTTAMIPNQPRRGPSRWHFDVDKHVNPFFPASVLPRFPAPVAHFLGYRTHPPHPLGNLAMIFWAVIGVFSSLAIIGAVTREVPAFQARGVPTIIGSFVSPILVFLHPSTAFPSHHHY
jgi:hypothetical protein